jgi:hypothetical protein
MGTFDPSTFLDVTINEANSTSSTPVPEGEYTAVAGEPAIREWRSQAKGTSGLALDIPWTIDDSRVKEITGRDTNVVKQGLMLDTTESGALATGKGQNVGLGRLREALDLNSPGKPFSFRMIQGQVARVSVKHRVDGDQIFADVKGVARLT